MKIQFLAAIMALTLGACGSDTKSGVRATVKPTDTDSPPALRKGKVAGLIDSKDWVYADGTAKLVKDSKGKDALLISLGEGKEQGDCSGFFAGNRGTIAQVPNKTGKYPLGQLALNIYARVNGNALNRLATQGYISITQITDKTVTGGLVARYDANNLVNGTFQIKLCK